MDYVETSYFLEEIGKSNTFKHSELIVWKNGGWVDAKSDDAVADQDFIEILNKKPKSGHLKVINKSDSTVFFWLAKNQAVIKMTAKKKTHESTVDSMLLELKKILKAANLEYSANHDALTGLLNRNGVKLGVEKHFQHLTMVEDDQNIEESTAPRNSVAIFSFDIDHFKQVNDAFGHGVGDAVLKIFSSRLKKIQIELSNEFANTFILSRPGGEEFELISIGSNHRAQLNKIADLILKSIRMPPIPTDAEIDEAVNEGSSRNFPQKILTSVGVAHQSFKDDEQGIDYLMEDIRKKADLALYRAKTDGRDCVRYFDDIRLNHGRVIEYHPNSELAVIDIGRAVNVKPGDLYSVNFPPFTGDKECVVDDGRSRKRLGAYIPVESAQIRVINSQENISTCLVVSRQTNEPIPVGALLRRVATGSKPILVEPRHLGVSIGGRARLVGAIQDLLANKSPFAVLNLHPVPPSDLSLEKRSQILADYVSAIHMIFPAGTGIFAGDGFNVFVAMRVLRGEEDSAEDDPEEVAQSYISSLVSGLEKYTKSRVGVFLSLSTPDGVNVTPDIVLHFARAALIASVSKPAVRFFQPAQTLSAWKKAALVDECLADYKAFKSYGVVDSSMENQLGLSILAADDSSKYPLADLAFGNANSQDPRNRFFAANAALIKARLGRFNEAFGLLSSIDFSFFERNFGSSYSITYGKSAFEISKTGDFSTTELHALLSRLFPKGRTVVPNKHPIYATWMRELIALKLVA